MVDTRPDTREAHRAQAAQAVAGQVLLQAGVQESRVRPIQAVVVADRPTQERVARAARVL